MRIINLLALTAVVLGTVHVPYDQPLLPNAPTATIVVPQVEASFGVLA